LLPVSYHWWGFRRGGNMVGRFLKLTQFETITESSILVICSNIMMTISSWNRWLYWQIDRHTYYVIRKFVNDFRKRVSVVKIANGWEVVGESNPNLARNSMLKKSRLFSIKNIVDEWTFILKLWQWWPKKKSSSMSSLNGMNG